MSYSLPGIYGGTREGVILVSMTPPSTHTTKPKARNVRSNGHANGNGDRRRDELADFLRQRRATIQPDDVGLPAGGRRRTPGLRREEVAQLAGVGTTWYTWLEQGRDVHASNEVLGALADALRLDRVERQYLFELSAAQAAEVSMTTQEVAQPLRRMLHALTEQPAYIINRHWDVLYWNKSAEVVFGDYSKLAGDERNSLCMLFGNPEHRRLLLEWY